MKEFQNLCELASIVNCTDFAKKMTSIVKILKSDEFTRVGIFGLNPHGRRSFINRIVEREIWTEDTFYGITTPLRLSFEPVQTEENFNCVMVANQAWRDLTALIYELNDENFRADDKVNTYKFDMLFVVVSATSLFNENEVSLLRAVASLKRQVAVGDMSYVREPDREKIKTYITKINDSLNLPPAIIVGEVEDCAKIVRGLIPAYLEQQQLREKKCTEIYTLTADTFERAARAAISAEETNSRQAVQNLSFQNAGLMSKCYTLRMDIEDYKKAAVERTVGRLSSRRENIVNEILSEAKKINDRDKIQAAVEAKYRTLAKLAIETLDKIFLEDLGKVNSSAQLLGVPQWNSATVATLKNFSPQEILNDTGMKTLRMKTNSQDSSEPIFLGSGLVASGMILAPLPPLVSGVGVAMAVGYGLFSHFKRKDKSNQQIVNALRETIRQAIDNIKDLVRKIAATSYDKIIAQILQGEQTLKIVAPLKNESKLAQLNDIIRTCEQLREILKNDLGGNSIITRSKILAAHSEFERG